MGFLSGTPRRPYGYLLWTVIGIWALSLWVRSNRARQNQVKKRETCWEVMVGIGQQCMLLPNKTITEIQSVYIEDDEYKYANPGNNYYL